MSNYNTAFFSCPNVLGQLHYFCVMHQLAAETLCVYYISQTLQRVTYRQSPTPLFPNSIPPVPPPVNIVVAPNKHTWFYLSTNHQAINELNLVCLSGATTKMCCWRYSTRVGNHCCRLLTSYLRLSAILCHYWFCHTSKTHLCGRMIHFFVLECKVLRTSQHFLSLL